MRWDVQHNVATLHIRADSELLVKQMKGQYGVKNAGLLPLFEEAKALGSAMKPWMRLARDLGISAEPLGVLKSARFLPSTKRMTGNPKPPTWDEIHNLIRRADEVCRESENIRVQAERARHRPEFWPDRRQPPRKHGYLGEKRRAENDSTPEGNEGTL